MTTKTDTTPFRVSFGERFDHVRGRDAAHKRLADYLGTTAEDVKANRRRLAGTITRITAEDAKSVGI